MAVLGGWEEGGRAPARLSLKAAAAPQRDCWALILANPDLNSEICQTGPLLIKPIMLHIPPKHVRILFCKIFSLAVKLHLKPAKQKNSSLRVGYCSMLTTQRGGAATDHQWRQPPPPLCYHCLDHAHYSLLTQLDQFTFRKGLNLEKLGKYHPF